MYILFISISIMIIISFFMLSGFRNPSNYIKVGEKAPLFELFDQDKELFSLKDYNGKKMVIYFFPKAFTPGWTKQACGFRDQYSVYRENNIEIIGISYDARETQKSFSEKHKLNFRVLSDSKKEVSKLYGVDTYFFPKRVTFLIDENGIVFDVIDDMSLGDYAENIIQIFKKHNIKSNENIKK